MRAVLVDANAAGHLKLGEAQEPDPKPGQALVAIKAISLNLGEVKRARRGSPGQLLGWDLAGIVEKPAADGSGPKAGARVVGLVPSGAWAERAAVDSAALAALPDNVSFAHAATLPVAGLTALYALEQAGQLLGRRVLVTGASGGVGLYGIQLAAQSGALATALVRQPKQETLVRGAGAVQVVVGERAGGTAAHGPFHCVLESVGGPVLADCLGQVAQGGVLVSYGISSEAPATIDVGQFFRTGRVRYYGLMLFSELGRRPASDGLAVLAGLMSQGRLQPHIDADDKLGNLGKLAERLYSRQIVGKAVLHVD